MEDIGYLKETEDIVRLSDVWFNGGEMAYLCC